MKSRTLTCIAAVTLFAALAFPVPSGPQQQTSEPLLYTVASLGTLGGTFSDTGGVNNQGQAVGGSTLIGDTAIHAFLWDKGVISDLGTLGGPNSFANGVSNTTGVVGTSDISSAPGNPNLCFEGFVNTTNQCRAFLWQNGMMTDLGTLGGASSSVGGVGVNSSGQVVGAAETATPDPNNPPYQIVHAFLWDRGEMTDLGTLGGPNSVATAINDKGRVVGQSDISTPSPSCGGCLPAHAFLLEHGGAMRYRPPKPEKHPPGQPSQVASAAIGYAVTSSWVGNRANKLGEYSRTVRGRTLAHVVRTKISSRGVKIPILQINARAHRNARTAF